MIKYLYIAPILLSALLLSSAGATSPLEGHVIALDAGHGAGDTGAIGVCGESSVEEVAVNLATRDILKTKLELSGATVFEVPQLSSRKDRVAVAEEAGSEVLISIHHNGSFDTDVNYTRSFITQGNDKKLAVPVHDELVSVFGPDKGIKHDGFGITVYGDIPGVLTESYFITNTEAACDFIVGGKNLVEFEAQAMHDGLQTYFLSSEGGDGGGDTSCPPGKQKQGKC